MSGHQWCEMGRRRFVVMRPRIGGGLSKVATVESQSVAEFLCEALDMAADGEKLRKDLAKVSKALPAPLPFPVLPPAKPPGGLVNLTSVIPPGAVPLPPGLNLPPFDPAEHETGTGVEIPARPVLRRVK